MANSGNKETGHFKIIWHEVKSVFKDTAAWQCETLDGNQLLDQDARFAASTTHHICMVNTSHL